jgi:hypothetical protein
VSPAQLVTLVETPEFIRRTEKLLYESEREALIGYLAANPTAGDLIPGSGGVRKLRWGSRGARQTRRCENHLFLSQFPIAAVPPDGVRKE